MLGVRRLECFDKSGPFFWSMFFLVYNKIPVTKKCFFTVQKVENLTQLRPGCNFLLWYAQTPNRVESQRERGCIFRKQFEAASSKQDIYISYIERYHFKFSWNEGVCYFNNAQRWHDSKKSSQPAEMKVQHNFQFKQPPNPLKSRYFRPKNFIFCLFIFGLFYGLLSPF